MPDRLRDKVAVVTGAGRGIGRAYAHALAAEGAAVLINDLADGTSSPADEVVAEIEARGGRAIASHESVTSFQGAQRMMGAAVEAFGGVDILIANAGISRPAWISEASESEWVPVIDVHVNGTFHCLRHAAPLIATRGGGTIITTGDVTTTLYFPRLAAYRAAKAAIAVLTLYAAREFADRRISVNSVMPGATDTRMMRAFIGTVDDGFLERSAHAYRRAPGPATVAAATPESVPPLGVYLCTDAGRAVTGRLFALYRENIRLVVSDVEVSTLTPEAGAFEAGELERRIPEWLDGLPASYEVAP